MISIRHYYRMQHLSTKYKVYTHFFKNTYSVVFAKSWEAVYAVLLLYELAVPIQQICSKNCSHRKTYRSQKDRMIMREKMLLEN